MISIISPRCQYTRSYGNPTTSTRRTSLDPRGDPASGCAPTTSVACRTALSKPAPELRQRRAIILDRREEFLGGGRMKRDPHGRALRLEPALDFGKDLRGRHALDLARSQLRCAPADFLVPRRRRIAVSAFEAGEQERRETGAILRREREELGSDSLSVAIDHTGIPKEAVPIYCGTLIPRQRGSGLVSRSWLFF